MCCTRTRMQAGMMLIMFSKLSFKEKIWLVIHIL
jgi:hypothetical protein